MEAFDIDLAALDIVKVRMNVTKIVTDWDALHRLMLSNFGRKDTFLYFGRNPQNSEIFRTLGQLAALSHTDMNHFMSNGCISFRDNHMLIAIKRLKGNQVKTKSLDIYLAEDG